MEKMEQKNLNINRKYPIELRIQNIIQFVEHNSTQDGIALENLYIGRLVYIKDELDSDEDKNLANRVSIVYLVDNLQDDILYMDLFKQRLYEKTTYVIPGVLSFAPFTRRGLTMGEVIKLSDLLNLERMAIDELSEFYIKIENINYYDFLSMPLNTLLDNEFKR